MASAPSPVAPSRSAPPREQRHEPVPSLLDQLRARPEDPRPHPGKVPTTSPYRRREAADDELLVPGLYLG